MFIDTYAVRKHYKSNNLTILREHECILDQIDEKQGVRGVLQIDKYYPNIRNSLWAVIQKVHPRTIVVENDKYYAQAYEYVLTKNMRKEQTRYDLFIVNYKDEKFMENVELNLLREKVAAGDKLVIFTEP